MTLYSHYFQAAEVMAENFRKIDRRIKRSRHPSVASWVDNRIFFVTWLGFLAVTCEGFKKINVYRIVRDERPENFGEIIELSGIIGKLINKNYDALRAVRNNAFHLRDDIKAFEIFFSIPDHRAWVDELHQKLADFFSGYRIMCEVFYALEGRKSVSLRRGPRADGERVW